MVKRQQNRNDLNAGCVRLWQVVLPLVCAMLLGAVALYGKGVHQPILSGMSAGLAQALYTPDKNFLRPPDVLGQPVYLVLYAFFVLAVLGAAGTVVFCSAPQARRKDMATVLRVMTTVFFIAVLGWQTWGQIRFHAGVAQRMAGKTTEEKIATRFEKSLAFARYCRQALPGPQIGQSVTDLDMNRPQEMLTFIAVAYYLYPIDIRMNRDQSPTCQVIFAKENPLEAVGEGFRPLSPFDSRSVLAVKDP